jgi:hypothetical protein
MKIYIYNQVAGVAHYKNATIFMSIPTEIHIPIAILRNVK